MMLGDAVSGQTFVVLASIGCLRAAPLFFSLTLALQFGLLSVSVGGIDCCGAARLAKLQ